MNKSRSNYWSKQLTRRRFLKGAGLTLAGLGVGSLLPACKPAATPTVAPPTPTPAPEATPTLAPPTPPTAAEEITLQFFSPAQPRTDAEIAVAYLADLFTKNHPYIHATWEYLPVPDSVHEADKLPPDVKKYTFVTFLPPTDFLTARAGGGPPQHKYNRAFTDLLFAAHLGIRLGWTFLTRDPALAADPKKLIGKTVGLLHAMDSPIWGSPQLLSNALLRDAWGIIDEVNVIEAPMLVAVSMLDQGTVDACFWGQSTDMSDGTFTLPGPYISAFQATQYYFIPVTQEDVDKINAANIWKISLLNVPKGSIIVPGPPSEIVNPPEDITVPNFGGAWAPWEDTEEEVVYEMLRFINENADKIKADKIHLQVDPEGWAQWPGLTRDMVHPGALRFYEEQGIKIGE